MPTAFSSAISVLRGGAWLLESSDADAVFTPERLTEEHRLIGQMTKEFVDNEVMPARSARTEGLDAARKLVRRCGDLGLLGVDVPEVYGGVGLDKVTSVVVSEKLSHAASFGASFGAQANLTVVPLFLFGTEAQKQRYLPKLLSGRPSAYAPANRALDPMRSSESARHAATDGSFMLNGGRCGSPTRLCRRLHRLRESRRRARRTLHGVHRGTGVCGREQRHGRAQARPTGRRRRRSCSRT
jgi:hypothetical protein